MREETRLEQVDEGDDGDAATAFAERAWSECGDSINRLIAFGDAMRGDDRGVHASIEFLIVLEEDDDGPTLEERERRLERLGKTVGIEREVVVEVYVLPADRFEDQQEHPLVEEALEEGVSYV
ncbi:hypothetical protein [Natronobacterium gregoryi]|uniref:Uncharacterized protein n=2 Tax=Natronobacterium gregoryi TaxID=44930 RepID=L0AKA0_NATGS|nr:hypothetical protein [Natronobacterium gregoryi]AFZ73485.1 hypothetical protein Natgr_2309 [Natronobacterium gregoryi SP2]ELY68338.1 hypothetical protein C490_09698 [Natronobacterium gregoryi SP2]PLK20501.1 hypothetical protein CYV19_09230 [Natronobacterium gregoryi SP2]SFI70929.1 hypothetical protein SAMN05443661_10418 [Natronobacterium gregoryi]